MRLGAWRCTQKNLGAEVEALLGADNVYLVGSVAAPRYGHTVPLAEQIKARDDVTVIHMKKSTREEARQTAEAAVDSLLRAVQGSDKIKKRKRSDE